MSKFCPNCKAEMPEEANFCLNCMNACDNTTPATSAKKKHASCKTRVFEYINKFKLLSKKQKAAILGSILCFITLIPFSVYMLTPSDNISENPSIITEQNGDNKGRKKPTRAETILNKLLGKENNKSTDNESVTATANALAKAGASSVTASDNESSAATDSSKSGNTKNSGGTNKNNGNHNGNSETPSGSGGSSNNTNESPTDNNNGSESTSDSANEDTEPVLDYNDWEYTINSSDELIITKYTGDDTNVLVPDKINGKDVKTIEKNTFLNNNTVKTITFKDSEDYHAMWINSEAFSNCKALQKIIFPDNTNLGIREGFAMNTPQLSSIDIDFWQYRFINGGLFSYNGSYWTLFCYCEGYNTNTLNIPEWCRNITNSASQNIQNNQHLKIVNIPANCYAMQAQWHEFQYKNLLEINVDTKNANYKSENGVLYHLESGLWRLHIYPAGKTDKTFRVIENGNINCYGMKGDIYPYIETIYLPKTAVIYSSTLKSIYNYFPKLKTIYMEQGHSKYKEYKATLDGIVNVVEY